MPIIIFILLAIWLGFWTALLLIILNYTLIPIGGWLLFKIMDIYAGLKTQKKIV